MREIEAKILEIDPAALLARLRELGATISFEGELQAIFFDHPADSLLARGAVLRLRKEGPQVVLTYKSKVENGDPSLKELEEIEVSVGDVESMRGILAGMGYRETRRTRKYRRQYELPGAHVVVDEYQDDLGHIPPLCEIEAQDAELLYEAAAALGYAKDQLCNWNSFQLEAHYRKK